MSLYPGPVPVADVHRWKTEATQRLLGYTIAFTDDQWHQSAALPGWSRAHVASHLARNADYLRAVLDAISAGGSQPPLPSSEERRDDLERGADRHGLELQIDLDGAAGALQNKIEQISDWTPLIRIDGAELPLSVLPLVRLHEVSVHLLDLDCGLSVEAIPADASAWLLRWVLFRLRDANLPAIEFTSDSLTGTIGTGTDVPLQVVGTDTNLWAWLAGRVGAEFVSGADDLRLPLLP